MSEPMPFPLPLESIEQMLQRIHVGVAFGPPLQVGENTLIPVAEVSYSLGYGFGRGPGEKEAMPGGGGGGMGGRVRPMGYIRAAPEAVIFEPAVDVSRLGLAGIAMTAWCVFWLARAIRALARKK